MNIQTWKIANLKSHADQQTIYGDLGAEEFDALKDDIAGNGLRQPIEITPDGTIIDGHQRVRAYGELGYDEIDVIVVDGLDAEELKERFILANLLRRQLGPVAKARAIKAVAEIQRRREGQQLNVENDTEFRDRLARQLGGNISGRTIGRYLQLLRLPRPIQDAVSSGDLPMTKALKLEALKSAEQRQIALRIDAGESARRIVDDYVNSPPPPPDDTPAELYGMLINFVDESLPVLESEAESLAGMVGNHDKTASLLDRTAVFCCRMKQLELEAKQDAVERISRKLGGDSQRPAGHAVRQDLPNGT